MELIDWRELYASNRAVIEGREPLGPRGGGARLALPRQTPGELIRLEHDDGPRARPVFVYAPPDLDPATPAPLLVMLHGCTQSAASFSAGSLMNRTADRHGFVVAYPEQSREDNPSCCWNWFSTSHQARGGGEPASIAGATRAVAEAADRWTIDPARVFVAGMSAGGAMAAVMAATYPDVFAALAIHSGLAFGSARSLPAAMQAMSRGGPDPEAQGDAAFAAMNAAARVVPALVIHGSADAVVDPVNADHAVRQWMATNRRAAGGAYEPELDHPHAAVRDDRSGTLPFTRRTWLDASGRVVQELIEVEGLGHAWSGGSAGAAGTHPPRPSAAGAVHHLFPPGNPRRTPPGRGGGRRRPPGGGGCPLRTTGVRR